MNLMYVSVLTYTVVSKRISVVIDYGGGKVDVSRRAPLWLLLHWTSFISILNPPVQTDKQVGYKRTNLFSNSTTPTYLVYRIACCKSEKAN